MRSLPLVVTSLVSGFVLALLPWLTGAAAAEKDPNAALARVLESRFPAAQRATTGLRIVATDDTRGTLAAALDSDDPRLPDLARQLPWDLDGDVTTAPHLALYSHGGVPLDVCEPVGGARPGTAAVRAALARFVEGSRRVAELHDAFADAPEAYAPEPRLALVRAREAAGQDWSRSYVLRTSVQRERSTVGPLHRARAYRQFLAGPLGDDPAATVKAYLANESDPGVLREGWSLVATLYEDAYHAATDPEDRADALDALLMATREIYRRTPDRDLVPMLEVVLERFARQPEELDAMDRMFVQGRRKALTKLAPDSPWAQE